MDHSTFADMFADINGSLHSWQRLMLRTFSQWRVGEPSAKRCDALLSEKSAQEVNRGIFSTADRLSGAIVQLRLPNRGSTSSWRDSKKVLYTIELPFGTRWHLPRCRRDTVVRAPKSA